MMARSTFLPPEGSGALGPWGVAGVTALAYAAVGWIALMVAGPPGYASPLYPSAGIALAATLTWGAAALPGVWLGSFVVNLGLGAVSGQEGLSMAWLPAAIACGAALQAAVGMAGVRRHVGLPVVLNSPREIALTGFYGAVLACAVSPSVATLALLGAGALNADTWLSNWLTWWVGDTLGTLIAVPLVLTLIGRPAADWRPRRLTLGLPLLVAAALMAVGLAELDRANAQRLRATFEHDADQAASRVQSRLLLPLFALQALHGAAHPAAPAAMPQTMRQTAAWWLAQDMPLQSFSWFVRVPLVALPAFEAEARQQGLTDFRVFDRDGGTRRAADGEVMALRFIVPETGNRGALGVNMWSVAATREALEASARSGQPSASAGFRLTQSADDETGLTVYQALFEGQSVDPATRQPVLGGAVSVAFRAASVFAPAAGGQGPIPAGLHWCLVDPSPGVQRRRLAGAPGCDEAAAPAGGHHAVRSVQLADRSFELRLSRDAAANGMRQPASQMLLSLAGLSAAAMLGALLLMITGHSRRTEVAVQAGTASLRREMDERGQAEEALRDSEERLRSILDNVPLGVVFLDPDGRLIDANPPLARMIGKPLDEMRGQRLDAVVVPGDRLAMRFALDELIAAVTAGNRNTSKPRGDSGSSVRRTLHFTGDPARPTSVRISAVPLRDSRGAVRRIVAVVEDITEHIQLEASEHARQRAEASNRAKSEFVSRMSHELRTPLNAMIGFAQLLGLDREPALVSHQREWAQQIQRAGWHLLEMINETLDLARIESGAVRLALQPVAVAPLVAAAQSMVSVVAGERGVHLHAPGTPPDTRAAVVQADPTRLRQILTNLLSNAVKYNRSGGSVGVTMRRAEDGFIEVLVADTGLGMTAAQMQLLFQPYNRLGREAGTIEGTGIGLVISRRLAELMGGTLQASSTAGVGSEFTLRLPPAQGDVEPTPQAAETGPAPYRQRTVHYIEDNETNVELMRGVLLQRPQIELSVSGNGLDGVQAVRRLKPDLVLLDMGLPDISGLELLRHLKQDDDIAGIPVIVVSADATAARIEAALRLGALQYVTKPLEVARFLTIIDEALQGIETRWGV